MKKTPLVSIIINNYNYGRFLKEAIDSALSQTYKNVEVIVVDDGSTDDSRKIITSYGNKVVSIFKKNGGQLSAYEVGFNKSVGKYVIFLDSDDILRPKALQEAVSAFSESGIVRVHWPVTLIDEKGNEREAKFIPALAGLCSRSYLKKIFPATEKSLEVFRYGADAYVFALADLFGQTKIINEPEVYYRKHARNHSTSLDIYSKIEWGKRLESELVRLEKMFISKYALKRKIDSENVRYHHDLDAKLKKISGIVQTALVKNKKIILIDDCEMGITSILGVRYVPFLELNGVYNGRPRNSREAISELSRLQRKIGSNIIIFWETRWWLEYYSDFRIHLDHKYKRIFESRDVIVFDQRPL